MTIVFFSFSNLKPKHNEKGKKNYFKLKCKELQIGSKQDEIYFYQMMLKDIYSGSQTETQHFHYKKKTL